jgi:deoxyribodipyrimidine photo-lyase
MTLINTTPVAVCWFRRDLRLDDHAALYHALKSGHQVLPVFIFDRIILDKLDDPEDKRLSFIYSAIQKLNSELYLLGSSLKVIYDTPLEAWKTLLEQYQVKAVFVNHDYEPYAQQRDKQIADLLKERGIAFHTFKDQCIFEKDEVLTDALQPYTVFTPYSRKWKAKLNPFYLKPYPTGKYFVNFLPMEKENVLPLEDMGFRQVPLKAPSDVLNLEMLIHYHQTRDFPAILGTSRMGVHLRFGTVSIRKLATTALQHNETFLNELIWREFYMGILWHFPSVVGAAFKPANDRIQWRNNETEFAAWCEGMTGYPIVDAGMRELNTTGYMHNRVRMVVASFLTKHLLIDWRWGEAYFAQKLLDFDLSANNGGWQWAAGCGTDAAPYFRVFNPYLQTEKFDPKLAYIRKWVPEFQEFTYPKPIVNHDFARKRCLEAYKVALTE